MPATPNIRTLLLIILAAAVLSGQIPRSQKLSGEDAKGFTAEINRLKLVLSAANDKPWVQFEIARTYAAGGQYQEAIDWLRKVVAGNFGFDPSRDRLFAKLRGTTEFQELLNQIRANTPFVSHSRPFAAIPEANLFPENFAFDAPTRIFYLGSTFKDEIVRCEWKGICQPFVAPHQDGLGLVLGLKIHSPTKTLWTTSNTAERASLRHYSLASGKLIRSFALSGAHLFNDLAVSANGDVFVTDTKEGAVYKLSPENTEFQRLVPTHVFTGVNGIALSPDEKTLFVASFPDGISAINLTSESITPMAHPADVCLAYVDGLYASKDHLIAIQNGPMLPRIVRFDLNDKGTEIVAMKILERRNPLFDGITTGVLTNRTFYYIANTQLDKLEGGKIRSGERLDSIRILAIDID